MTLRSVRHGGRHEAPEMEECREAAEMRQSKCVDVRPATLHKTWRMNMQSVARLKTGAMAAVNETISLNDVESDLEKARFDHQTKLLALQQEFNGKRDKLRQEYHERVQEITGDAA